MAVVKNLMVRAGADFSAITKQANKAKTSMRGMSTSVSASCSRMSAAMAGINKALGLLGVALSAGALISAGKKAKEAFDEQAEASAKLAQVMRNTMHARSSEIRSVEDLIDAQERLGIVKGDVQTEAAQELGTYLTLSKSLKTLIPVMNDMVAQQYGIGASAESAVSIATMMGKVMNGQTSALSRYGYTFDVAQEKILKFGSEEERAATLAEVVEQSVGGMNAALAATPNGRLQQVSNTLGKIQEEFGRAVSSVAVTFLPALNAVCSILASMATLANKVAQAIANVFGRSGGSAAQTVRYTAAAASGMDDLTDSTKAAGKAAESLSTMGFDTLQKLSSPASGSSSGSTGATGDGGAGAISTGIEESADQAGESLGWLERGLNRIKETIGKLDFSRLTTAFGRLKDALAPFKADLFSGLSWLYDNILEPLAMWTIGDAVPAFLDLLASGLDLLHAVLGPLKPLGDWLWKNFLKPLASWTGGAIVTVIGKLSKALEKLSGWIDKNRDTIEKVITVVAILATVLATLTSPVGAVIGAIALLVEGQDVLKESWNVLKTVGAETWAKIQAAWNGAGAWFTATVVEPIRNTWSTGMTAIHTLGTNALNLVKAGWGKAAGWFKSTVISPISSSFKSFANGILGFFEGIANGAIKGVNKIIAGLNRISFNIPSWVPGIGGKSFGFNLKTISGVKLPRLAAGAVIPPNDSFAAILGDQKSGTNIETPERLLRQIYREENGNAELVSLLQALLSAVRAGHVIQLDRKQVGKTAQTERERMARAYSY